jgi:hypothetical protein
MQQNLTNILNVESVAFLNMSVNCTVLFTVDELRD